MLAEGVGQVSQSSLSTVLSDGNAGGKMARMLEMCFEKHAMVVIIEQNYLLLKE